MARLTARVWRMLLGAGVLLVARAAAQECPGSSGSQYASCCHALQTSYDSLKASYESPTPTFVDWTYTYIYTQETNVPFTTLCDGFPRAMQTYGPGTYLTEKTTPTPGSSSTIWITNTYESPRPTCTINEADCVPYANAWSASYEAWKSDQNLPYPTETLHCTTYLPCPTGEPSEGEQVCKLYANDATVYYWPVTTAGDFCGVRTTLTSRGGDTTTKSTVVDGATFVSPTAYMRIGTAYAKRHNGRYTATECGYGRENLLLTFPAASQISTRHWKPGTTSNTTPLDVGDLNTPFPASAYFTGKATVCTTAADAPCPTIGGDYSPTLDIPMPLMTADPEWAHCTPRSEGFGDATFVPLEPVTPNWPRPTKVRRS